MKFEVYSCMLMVKARRRVGFASTPHLPTFALQRFIYTTLQYLLTGAYKRQSKCLLFVIGSPAIENHCCLNKFGCCYALHLFVEDQWWMWNTRQSLSQQSNTHGFTVVSHHVISYWSCDSSTHVTQYCAVIGPISYGATNCCERFISPLPLLENGVLGIQIWWFFTAFCA